MCYIVLYLCFFFLSQHQLQHTPFCFQLIVVLVLEYLLLVLLELWWMLFFVFTVYDAVVFVYVVLWFNVVIYFLLLHWCWKKKKLGFKIKILFLNNRFLKIIKIISNQVYQYIIIICLIMMIIMQTCMHWSWFWRVL